MVKRKSRITERNTEPQKDNTLIATTPPPDSRVPGVIANHDAMVQWNLEHPDDKVYRIEDLIQKEKEANPSWVKRAANLAVNPVPTSNSGMMAVPNPDNPVRSTVKDELRVAMAAASTPMIGAELGIYGPVYGGLRLAAGSAAATGAYHVAGKAGDWIDEKAGTNWVGDLNRTVAPFAAFPLGAKYAYRGAVPLVGLASRYGTVPDWIATPKVKMDAIKWGLKQRYKADIATPKIETEPTLQIGPEARPQLTGHFGKVKYYGPTMGKTTAARSNRGFIDFDDVIRNPSRAILDRFGFKTKADLYNSGNQEAIKAYEDMLLHEMQAFRANPENQGKRLLVSPSAVANPEVTGFDFDNIPVVPSRDVFIERNVARGGTPEESAEWYDALLARNPNLQIDDRFVSDIEKPFYVAPQASLRNITLDELRGIPKGERNARKPQPRVVNRDGSINWINLQKAYDNLINRRGKWLKHDLFEEGLNNAPGEASTLWGHTTGVVKTAQQIPVPKGSSRAELVRAALIHDLGKLETGQEMTDHPNHPYISEDMIYDFGFPEFDTPTIRSTVRGHMNEGGLDQFMKSGIEKEELMPGVYEITNFDLLKALQAADVARGLSYDAAAARFPQLFRYQKQTPFKVNWFSGTPEEEITRVVNPILKREGYPVISLKDPIIPQLTDRRKRHRSFFRAIDIDGEPVDYQGMFNRQELGRQALKNFGSDSDMFKRIAAATMTSREPTGGLKAFAIGVDHDGYWDGYGRRAEHVPTRFSRRIKFSPYRTDALFLSTSPHVVRDYSGKEPGSAIVGYLPMYPMQEGESPVQFMERTEFPMMDSDAILSDNTPMSLWQKYGWPYRMQTGRSLLSDLRDAYTGRLRELNKIGEWYNDPTTIEKINKMVQELNDLGFNFKPPMNEKKGVFLVTSKKPYYNLFSENNLDRKTNILLQLGLITPKQARWRSFIPRGPHSWLYLDPNEEIETFKKYVWNKNTIRKIVNKLFEKTPRHMVVSKEYKDYLKDEKAIIKFLRDRGIRPLWELPHFYQPIVFKGHGSFGSKPVTRGKEFTEGDGQGFVLAPKDSKVLEYREDVDPETFAYDDYERWTDELVYPVSRKTFKKGGIIKGQDGIEELPVQKSSTNVAQKPIPRRALSPIESDWEEANHDPNLYEYQPSDDPYVKEFFEQDVLPRYMRENPNASQEEIDAVRSAYTNKQIMSNNMDGRIGGRTDTDKFYFYGIPINPSRRVEYNSNYKLSRPVIVHENTHAYRQGLLGNIGEGKYTVPYKRVLPPFLGFGEGSGYTNKEVDYLQNGYDLSGFDFSDYGSEENQKFARLIESGTTNAEIRYRLWRELYDNLGKVPTLEETDEFIKNYDKSKLWSLINNASAYGQKAYHNMIWNAINSSQELPEDHTDQDEINLRNETESQAGDRLKDALIHVADNNQKTDMTNLARKGTKLSRFKSKLHK